MLGDLERLKLLDRTLVIAMGELGRTPGGLTPVAGREHYPDTMFAVFAGAGVRDDLLRARHRLVQAHHQDAIGSRFSLCRSRRRHQGRQLPGSLGFVRLTSIVHTHLVNKALLPPAVTR
ncbi:MAG: DUF1501 domain-containing protein [Acidobacteria bacterium]|nr:DUF1501 domain-containing protein [Acidobacteriota bacterium]